MSDETHCNERCVGAECQALGEHKVHWAVVPYLNQKFEEAGYVRLEWPVPKPGSKLKAWENL
jgi:hypothetical protein